MPLSGIANPDQLALLRQVLREHCLAHVIEDTQGQDDAARLLVALFENGAQSYEELTSALAASVESR